MTRERAPPNGACRSARSSRSTIPPISVTSVPPSGIGVSPLGEIERPRRVVQARRERAELARDGVMWPDEHDATVADVGHGDRPAREHVGIVRCVEEAGGRAGDVNVAVAPQDAPTRERDHLDRVLLLLVADHRGVARREERVVIEPERHRRDLRPEQGTATGYVSRYRRGASGRSPDRRSTGTRGAATEASVGREVAPVPGRVGVGVAAVASEAAGTVGGALVRAVHAPREHQQDEPATHAASVPGSSPGDTPSREKAWKRYRRSDAGSFKRSSPKAGCHRTSPRSDGAYLVNDRDLEVLLEDLEPVGSDAGDGGS